MDKNVIENISFEKDFVILHLVGKLSIVESGTVEAVIQKYLEKKQKNIILDLEKVSYISSSFIGLLANYKRLIEKQTGTFNICSPNAFVIKILTVTNLIKIFELYPNLQEAISSIEIVTEKNG